ncbi:hypothetical protein [Cellulomonas fengjieae]|uniref:DUF3558 domain-containing protein n=1 Tax=Cellulomonas fengjieae TaxID=2819978 RepID=A0ABS3SF71_9CELL|nr:hypothetical protein [Cellulomonas fengjieae]MBO3084402.1 hypothetical protein [Cellulomonas fengjieae]MBO3103174.1 hypothetical protein [Cellulomonas fengjieae]QVI67251.1 hypothetical protein KG102_06685 [Cellulomonas fengjieae]
MRRCRRLVLAGTLLGALVATGCTADPEPVPRTAGSPWLCSGVPRDSIDLALGGAELDEDSGQGSLGWRDDGFDCAAQAGDSTILVAQQTVLNSGYGSTEEEIVETLEASSDGRRIDADAPGRGYLVEEGQAVAVWVCTGFVTRVSFFGEPPRGRDWSEDAVNLLVSMLPWACGEEDAPPTD